MAIIRPGSFSFPRQWNPTQVPTWPPEIDQTNPLSAALADFVVFSKMANYAAPAFPPTITGNPVFVGTPAGQALQTPGNATNYLAAAQNGNIANTVPLSASVLWQPTATPAAYAIIFDTSGGTGRALSLFVDASLNFNFYGIGSAGGGLAITTGMVVGGLYEVTMTRDNSGLVSFYVNGVLKGTVAAITSMTTTASTTDFGFNVTGGGSDTAGNFLRWATWKNRTLTATEVMALANAPFAMLRPVVRRSYFVAAAAAPPPTGGPMLIPFGSRDLKGLATAAVVGTVLANPTLRRRQLLGGGDD